MITKLIKEYSKQLTGKQNLGNMRNNSNQGNKRRRIREMGRWWW
jgi:hypothetical protein